MKILSRLIEDEVEKNFNLLSGGEGQYMGGMVILEGYEEV